MKENKDGIIIIIAIFLLMGFGWDSFKEGAGDGSSGSNWFSGTSSVSNDATVTETPKSIPEQVREAEATIDQIEKKIEETYRSPSYGKVYLSYPTSLNDPDPSREYFTLTSNLRQGEYLDITGWYLRSTVTGNTAVIGRAATMPTPYVKGTENVVLKAYDRAYIIKGFSPIGTSFRTNICTGYFGQDRTFYPYINKQCPLAKNEDLPTFSTDWDMNDECIDYIETLPTCTVPRKLYTRNTREYDLPSGCKAYLETQINYNVCVQNHRYDSNFVGNEWYVYLERFGPLWRSQRETIQLRDREGLVVAEVKINY